ncbi:capsular polysaccharide transport system permease protein [Rhodobacter aestuarii]|uniref:Capsular polysaccharide transport system permease protein n=2 Tax=Rhodobacter aestuarii TaxID=453582 RepID=A0A1N7LDU9_9RHOB|nr:capsular polysaccharide transport system permease protein [Rhodobacter aestuarii]SIS71940.1 capsular polysaccharide transport system permease protein [Rhodobacter aestuarii]
MAMTQGPKAGTPPVDAHARRDLEAAKALSQEVRAQIRELIPRARTAASRAYGGGGFKPRRIDRVLMRVLTLAFLVIWVIPVVGGGVYYGFLAADQYVTESRFSINGGSSGVDLALGGVIGGTSSSYSTYAAEYIKSSNVVEDIRDYVDLKSVFGKVQNDPISGLKPEATLEETVEFWRNQIKVKTESLSGQVTFQLRAFTPEDSLALHEAVLAKTEAKINEISDRMRQVRLQEAEVAVARARTALEAALKDLARTREKHGILDVELSIRSYEELIQSLRSERAKLEQRLAVSRITTPNAPEVTILASQLDILNGQIDALNAKMASQTSGDAESLAAIAVDIGLRETDVTIARTELVARLADLETATSELVEQDMFVEINVRPTLPQKATYPKRWQSWALITAAATVLYLVTMGLGYLVRDNMG